MRYWRPFPTLQQSTCSAESPITGAPLATASSQHHHCAPAASTTCAHLATSTTKHRQGPELLVSMQPYRDSQAWLIIGICMTLIVIPSLLLCKCELTTDLCIMGR